MPVFLFLFVGCGELRREGEYFGIVLEIKELDFSKIFRNGRSWGFRPFESLSPSREKRLRRLAARPV